MSFYPLNRGEPDRVDTGVVSANFFDVLGVRPKLGRTFVDGDDDAGAPAVQVLSHEYWRTRFGGDPNIVGQTFQMNDLPHTVVGVLPPIPHTGRLRRLHADVGLPVPDPRRAAHRRAAPHLLGAAGLRPSEARSAAGGSRRLGRDRRGPIRPRSSRRLPRRPGVPGDGCGLAGRVDPQRPSDADGADRRDAAGAAHRLRQRRQPVDGARTRARARVVVAHRPAPAAGRSAASCWPKACCSRWPAARWASWSPGAPSTR